MAFFAMRKNAMGGAVMGRETRDRTFQHVAQRVLALDGHPSGGAGSDSDDWLKDSRSPSQISGRRLSAGLLGRGRLRNDYRRSQRVFRFLLQFDRTRRCLRAVLGGLAFPVPSPPPPIAFYPKGQPQEASPKSP